VTRRSFPLLGAALALLMSALSPVASAVDEGGSGLPPSCVHELRYELFAGLVLVSVTIDDSPPLDFVLDSGASRSAINDPHLAAALGLEGKQVGLSRGMGSGASVVVIADDVCIRSDGFEILCTSLVVHDIGIRLAEVAGREIDGFLGADLFQRYVVELDPVGRRLLLHDPTTFVYQGRGQALPLQVVDLRPVIEGSVVVEEGAKPIPVRLAVDTGSSRSLTLITKSRRRLKPPPEQSLGASVGVVGETLLVISPIRSISLGSFTLERVESAWAEPFRVPAVRNIPKLNGILGNRLLRRFRLFIDYSGERLILESLYGSSYTATEIPD
jgi:hypothetical protein